MGLAPVYKITFRKVILNIVMKFRIDAKIFALFPCVKAGVLLGKGLDNRHPSSAIAALLREGENDVRTHLQLEHLAAQPKISDWREAYRAFGFKPSSHRSSVEALLRRVLQGKELPSISPIVDLYNFISIKHMLPAGADDIDKVDGDIALTVADGTEHFVMLGTHEPEGIKTGEVVYRDDKEVLCRSWNYRECEKTKITSATHNVCLVLEGLENTSMGEIEAALAELQRLLAAHCGGAFQAFFLQEGQREASLHMCHELVE